MKNTIFKLNILLLFMLFSCKSVSQIPIVWGADNGILPNNYKSSGNYYYKDIPNYLDNFVGTWEYVNGNEKFQIILTKVVMYHQIDTKFNLNYYEDGIVLQYKKFVNNSLIFESPIYQDPNFRSKDGIILDGNITDYGRVTKTVYDLQIFGGGVKKQGGEYFYPDCIIKKLPSVSGQPDKIKFNLYMRQSMYGETNNEAYDGLPKYSIPNDIEMVKIN
ncbi:DUF6705 family protein [Flavobacterium sp. HNIBRBA15423]|uniref:DUF6705 family protein n=1 Tax=Flavobacterium sp. HNIBRBA15423 TaxID=3458683 RepID=UPI0040448AF0